MAILLASLGLFLFGGVAALAASRSAKTATALGAGSAIAGSALGLIPTLETLVGGAPPAQLRLAWEVPYGSFFVELDALSALFLAPIFLLSGLAALYGAGYLRDQFGRKAIGPHWFFYNLLLASMTLVIVARNGILFITAWEAMAIASFFLVTFDDEKHEVRQAGWTYLIAMNLGTAFLLAMFILLGRGSGPLDFDRFAAPPAAPIFLLALIGFGTKAGLMPFHVWLPEAHPAAPSHVSAVLSAVMIKTGIYGLVRTLMIFGPPPPWWGWTLVAIGAATGILGILFAIAQSDLKRMLAYSSVENIGIIAMGLGLWQLGRSYGVGALAALGLAGSLIHVVNHALFKGLLFLGAGAVLHGTGTRNLDRLGGLVKRMPWTGLAFVVAAAAIVGLPPLNGFVGEFVIFFAALGRGDAASILVIASLALIGGLAAAGFTRAFGIAFLGEPRSDESAKAHECGWLMRAPMLVLAAACIAGGVLAPLLASLVQPFSGVHLDAPAAVLRQVSIVSAVALAMAGLLTLLRRGLLARRTVSRVVTWDCGYEAPSARMQYTATSFAEPIVRGFAGLLSPRHKYEPPKGPFPREAALESETPDACREKIFRPAFRGIDWVLAHLRWLQHGGVHLYVLYIALTLLILLVWRLG